MPWALVSHRTYYLPTRRLDCSKWWLGELRCSEMRALMLTAEGALPW